MFLELFISVAKIPTDASVSIIVITIFLVHSKVLASTTINGSHSITSSFPV